MAVIVIELLEVVGVQEQHAHRLLLAADIAQGQPCQFEETIALQQAGQIVGIGLLAQLAFQPILFEQGACRKRAQHRSQ
jgi:hypothetical protein